MVETTECVSEGIRPKTDALRCFLPQIDGARRGHTLMTVICWWTVTMINIPKQATAVFFSMMPSGCCQMNCTLPETKIADSPWTYAFPKDKLSPNHHFKSGGYLCCREFASTNWTLQLVEAAKRAARRPKAVASRRRLMGKLAEPQRSGGAGCFLLIRLVPWLFFWGVRRFYCKSHMLQVFLC